ncbi:hydrophobin-251 [Coprinopsis cinerea AmutBmut pab1-1]|nr:hydrophobin-251 [Coprinopsis cinerea AmutBmut pab1-1]
MFARLTSTLFALAAVSAVFAAPGATTEQCNGGEVQCCNSVQDANNLDSSVKKIITGLLHLDLKQITGQVGVTCTSVNVLGIGGGSSCTQQKVCCTNNSFHGLIALGCTPINVSV